MPNMDNKCLSVLDFHHLDPSTKDFTISSNMKYFNIENL